MKTVSNIKPQDLLNSKTFYSPDGCWYWTGSVNKHGYGTLRLNKRYQYAHRLSFMTHNPLVQVTGLSICHTCDNRICVNPDHLFVGTLQDNMDDMVRKGRSSRGEDQHMSVLKTNDVIEILSLKGKLSQGKIAKIYNVTQGNVWAIHNRRIWKHLHEKTDDELAYNGTNDKRKQ